LTRIADGKYNLVISFIGYEPHEIPIEIVGGNNINVGDIKLGVKAEILEAVTVEGQKVLIEERVDRTIYNAENDATTRGGDATDVMKRVPLLSVDLDVKVNSRGT